MSKIKKNIKSLKGFTLLELIVVIAIISVLLMIIVPNMTDYIRTSRIREANDRHSRYMWQHRIISTLSRQGERRSRIISVRYRQAEQRANSAWTAIPRPLP